VSRFKLTLLAAALTSLIALAAHADGKPPAPVVAAQASAGVVNLNEANAEDLEHLPGIGPTKARLIVEHRHAHPFKKIEELTKVKGIGRKTFGKLRPYITLFGPTTLKADVHAN
jgi:competence protein ComEA